MSAGCRYFVHGNFNLDYVRSVSAGYGELTNDANSINGHAVTTPEERIALSDYVFVRIDGPFTADPDSGPLGLPTPSLEYAGAANASELADVKYVRDAIDAWNAGKSTSDPLYSRAQIVVLVDAGRPPVVSEILQHGVSGLYLVWSASDKVVMDTAFGIVNGRGTLPAGLPLSNTAAGAQAPDVAGDGQHATFVKGFGLQTNVF